MRVPWLGCGRREKQSRRSRGQGKGKKQVPPAPSTAPCPTPRCAWAEGWQELKRRHQGALGSTGGGGEGAGGSLLAAGIGFGSRKAQPSAFTLLSKPSWILAELLRERKSKNISSIKLLPFKLLPAWPGEDVGVPMSPLPWDRASPAWAGGVMQRALICEPGIKDCTA